MGEADKLTSLQREEIKKAIDAGLASLRSGKSLDGECVFDRLDDELDRHDLACAVAGRCGGLEEIIRQAIHSLADNPGADHRRSDLTVAPARFWAVFSYLVVYDPITRPLARVRGLHGNRDLEAVLWRSPTD